MTGDPIPLASSAAAGVAPREASPTVATGATETEVAVTSSANAASVGHRSTTLCWTRVSSVTCCDASAKTPRDATGPAVSVVVRAHFSPLGNLREHWRVRQRRVERERLIVGVALAGATPPALPVTVQLHRVGWCSTDPDNLVGCVKSPIDAIAQWLGVDDRDRRAHWRLSQSVDRTIPRVTKWVRGKLTYFRNAELRITVRPWDHEDGEAALVVAPAPKPKRIRKPRKPKVPNASP